MGAALTTCSVGAVLTTCNSVWDMGIQPALPQLALRVVLAADPSADGKSSSSGSRPSPFRAGEQLAVKTLERVKGWAPLQWRYEQSARERAAPPGSLKQRHVWPVGFRFSVQRRSWLATVMTADGAGGFKEHACLLQVSAETAKRSMQHVEADLLDWNTVAMYAQRFNTHLSQKADAISGEAAPSVQVSQPVGCEVLGSGVPQVIAAGDSVLVAPFSAEEVQKFVYDGREDFSEVPQAFFHYAAWSSGGRELVCDLQGVEQDDGSFLLVDPCVLRKAAPTVSDLLGSFAPPAAQVLGVGPASVQDGVEGRFDAMHPKCSQLCKVFDPQRKGGNIRTHCGMAGITCGM